MKASIQTHTLVVSISPSAHPNQLHHMPKKNALPCPTLVYMFNGSLWPLKCIPLMGLEEIVESRLDREIFEAAVPTDVGGGLP